MAAGASESEQTDASPDDDAPELPNLEQLIAWYNEWEDETHVAQSLARRDRHYYDGQQWTDEEVQELKARGQPVITINRIARKINFILGEEVKKRADPVAMPRTPQHEDAADAATDALRYVKQAENFDTLCGEVFADDLIEGNGACVIEVDDDEDGSGERPIRLRHVPWDRFVWDPHSRKPDFSDAKFLAVVVWMDLDDAVADYPDAEEALEGAVNQDRVSTSVTTDDKPRLWADGKRRRVKVVEMYFRAGLDWYRACFTRGRFLSDPEPTGYMDELKRRHVCPVIAVSCYVDSENMRYGVIRNLVSAQDEVNKRRSKAMHLLNVRQVIAEEGVILDPQKFQSELAKPDGFAIIQHDGLQGDRIKITTSTELAQSHLGMLQEAKEEIDSIGPSSTGTPDLPASSSGRAFIARQQAASQELEPVFSAFRTWRRQVFRQIWLRIRQFWTQEKWLRVTDDEELNGFRFVALNQQMTRAERLQELLQQQPPPPMATALSIAAGDAAPMVLAQAQAQAQQAQQMQAPPMPGQPPPQPPDITQLILASPLMQEPITLNQVEQLDVDILIDEGPAHEILAQEEFESMLQMMPTVVQARPDMAPTMIEIVVQASQLRSKRKLLQAMDKPPDPKEAQQQQQMKALQVALEQAQVQVAQTQAQLNAAKAAQAGAEAQAVQPQAAATVQHDTALSLVHAANAGATVAGK